MCACCTRAYLIAILTLFAVLPGFSFHPAMSVVMGRLPLSNQTRHCHCRPRQRLMTEANDCPTSRPG